MARDLFTQVIEWGESKGIDDPIMQFAKLNEEVGEIAHELTRNRRNSMELVDALGDTLVTLIILADILGFDLMGCLEASYNVIKDRKGKTVGGSFIKTSDEKSSLV